MKREKSSNVTCCMKKCSTIRASKYAPNAKTASSLSYMQATAASKSSSPFEDMHTQSKRWIHTRPITDSRIKWCADDTYIKWYIPLTQALDMFQVGEGRYARKSPLLQYQL